jgi:hypothetical protein
VTGNGNGHPRVPTQTVRAKWPEFLLAQTEELIDVYAAASKYAFDRHGHLGLR